jgi:hypothetical protein
MDVPTDPSGENPLPGAESQPPCPAAAPSSANPLPRAGLPASPGSDPAPEPLSRFQRLSLALSAIALVISALGFTAVIISIRTAQEQMSHMAAQTRVLTRDRSLNNVLTLDRIFLDHPELRPYFYAGKDLEESDPLYPKVETVADMHLDVYGYNLDYRLVFPDDYRRPEDYKRYIRSMLVLSPVMRRRLETKGEWFSPYLQEVLKGAAGSRHPLAKN